MHRDKDRTLEPELIRPKITICIIVVFEEILELTFQKQVI